MSPPTPPPSRRPETPVTVRDELEVLRVRYAPPADAVPFVRHVPPAPGSPEARRAVPVPLRVSPDRVVEPDLVVELDPVVEPDLVVELDPTDEPGPEEATAENRAPEEAAAEERPAAYDQKRVFTARDVLPERPKWRRRFSR